MNFRQLRVTCPMVCVAGVHVGRNRTCVIGARRQHKLDQLPLITACDQPIWSEHSRTLPEKEAQRHTLPVAQGVTSHSP